MNYDSRECIPEMTAVGFTFKIGLLTVNLRVKFNLTRLIHFPGVFLGEGPIYLFMFIFFNLQNTKLVRKQQRPILKEPLDLYNLSQILLSEDSLLCYVNS